MCESIDAMHRVIGMMEQNHMIISIHAERSFDKIQQTFVINTLNILGTEHNNGHIRQAHNKRILGGEKLKAFPLNQE